VNLERRRHWADGRLTSTGNVAWPTRKRYIATAGRTNETSPNRQVALGILKRASCAVLMSLLVSCTAVPDHTVPEVEVAKTVHGVASWYGPRFDGRLTASGETFDKDDLTAAHPTLPFGTLVRVTNESNGKSVVVRINDRGPFAGERIIDVSQRAAKVIGLLKRCVGPVQLDVLAAGA
jgi:rare lipoprotein A (peptidoglycan hydrolase)